MKEPYIVVLFGGFSLLAGKTGDWLLDYGNGSLGVVNSHIFSIAVSVKIFSALVMFLTEK